MTTTAYDLATFDPDHHQQMADIERRQVETFRSYLTWATHPAVIAWAIARAEAAQIIADADAQMAAAARAYRQAGAA